MPILAQFRSLSVCLIALGCGLGACDADDTPDTPAYWDQAEVDTTCEAYANALFMCGDAGIKADEIAESCSESIMVDNPNEDADCYQAQIDKFACTGTLTCEQQMEQSDRVGDHPCKAEHQAIAARC